MMLKSHVPITDVSSDISELLANKPNQGRHLREVTSAGVAVNSNQHANRKSPPPSFPKSAPPPQFDHDITSGELVQTSTVMQELVQSIALVARSTSSVLISGESGTGKERVARPIHLGGERADQPFVAVNTSAIPEQLLESELFGHVSGAFTGAARTRRGLLLDADGGTLFLDEIGDMPLSLQPKLLRVLQFGEVRAVGSDRVVQADVRVIAATHRDLGKLVREGRFREDLHYRLNVIPLIVPPLRTRREDIQPLAEQFLQEARGRNVLSPLREIGLAAMTALTQADWPGNVRELENTIERLVVLGREAIATPHDLSIHRYQPSREQWPGLDDSPWTLRELEQQYINWLLNCTGGNKVRAAKILGVNLSTLYRREHSKH